jgi:hypothetical protein
MNCCFRLKKWVVALVLCGIPLTIPAQQAPKHAGSLPPNIAEKFAFGKSAYIKNEHGGNIAFEAISSDIEGWGRFVLLNSPEKADFVVEITSYEGGSVNVGSHTDYATPDGKPQQSSGASKDLSAATVNMKIYDATTRRELWSGTEKVKSAFKKKSEADNLVAAAEKLFLRFHDSVEPAK